MNVVYVAVAGKAVNVDGRICDKNRPLYVTFQFFEVVSNDAPAWSPCEDEVVKQPAH